MQPITLYTGAHCPYCNMAKQLLKSLGAEQITEIRVDENPDARIEMQQRTGRHTVPQIFIGQTHVGGFTDLHSLHQKGDLINLLNKE